MRILIADDSPIIRERLTMMIADLDGVVVAGEASDCAEAVQAVRSLRPDLVILDIRMPGGSGLDVLQAIKQEPRPPKVIMFTFYPEPRYRHRAEELGAEYFFEKGTEVEKLVDALKETRAAHGRLPSSKKPSGEEGP